MTDFTDIQAFHRKFGIDMQGANVPSLLPPELLLFRLGFLIEEVAEYAEANGVTELAHRLHHLAKMAHLMDVYEDRANLPHAARELVDVVVISLGNANLHALPWQKCWDEVHRANMSKARDTSGGQNTKRTSVFDGIIKPPGWKPPNLDFLEGK